MTADMDPSEGINSPVRVAGPADDPLFQSRTARSPRRGGFAVGSAEVMDPQHRWVLEVAWEALDDAGLSGVVPDATLAVAIVWVCPERERGGRDSVVPHRNRANCSSALLGSPRLTQATISITDSASDVTATIPPGQRWRGTTTGIDRVGLTGSRPRTARRRDLRC